MNLHVIFSGHGVSCSYVSALWKGNFSKSLQSIRNDGKNIFLTVLSCMQKCINFHTLRLSSCIDSGKEVLVWIRNGTVLQQRRVILAMPYAGEN